MQRFCCSYESTYVNSLPFHKWGRLNTVISGKSNGICMSIVYELHLWSSATSLEETAKANITTAYNIMKESFEEKCHKLRFYNRSHIAYGEFPPFPQKRVPKAPAMKITI